MQSPKCTVILVYPHAEKVPSPTSLLRQYVRCASNHPYVWWFREMTVRGRRCRPSRWKGELGRRCACACDPQ